MFSVAAGLAIYFLVPAIFGWFYYRLQRTRPESWKCQPRRFLPRRLRRNEIRLGVINMVIGSVISGLFIAKMVAGNFSSVVFDTSLHGPVGSFAICVVYFLITDFAFYWVHRILHFRVIFRATHRYHHQFYAPTAFSGAAMHPAEFFVYQAVLIAPLFFLPVHIAGVLSVWLVHQLVGLIDHSGVRMAKVNPFHLPPQYHDAHHEWTKVNFGQTLAIWDKLFGTFLDVDEKRVASLDSVNSEQ